MHSDFIDSSSSNLKTCMKCLDDSNDFDFWETHQELHEGIIWCTVKGQ
jgi:hypothetical protein